MSCIQLSFFIVVLHISTRSCKDEKLLLVTVATEESDGYKRFMRSARINNIAVEVFGLQQEWMHDDLTIGSWNQKLNLLRDGLEKYRDEENLILLFMRSNNVVLTANPKEILEKFKKFDANIVMATRDFIRPDGSSGNSHVSLDGQDRYQYLCSGGIIGYAADVFELMSLGAVDDDNDDIDDDMYERDDMFDDPMYHTPLFLDNQQRLNIKLDHRAELFQNLKGANGHVNVTFDKEGNAAVTNTRFKTTPTVLYGSGSSTIFLNHLANYVPRGWSLGSGCLSCNEDTINLESIGREVWPTVLIGIHIPTLTPFLEPFLQLVSDLDYPKDKIDIFVHNGNAHHSQVVREWVTSAEAVYSSVTYMTHTSNLDAQQGKNLAITKWRQLQTEYYFSIDNSVTLTNPRTLQLLIEQNKAILTPMMSKHEQLWSNFWGDLSSDGYYSRSPDYLEIVHNLRQGVWNSPYISNIYLVNSTIIDDIPYDPFLSANAEEPDLAFCSNLRSKGIFMYTTNLHDFGHLKEMDKTPVRGDRKNNDLYQLFDNKPDWEAKYLHREYANYLSEESVIPEPCTDVYWVPIVTEQFAQELVEECEHFGRWSGGRDNYDDNRIVGGYEHVPTVDIHMNQIGFDKHWIQMIQDYFTPMASRIFTGHFSRNMAHMNFVVKYTKQPGGQFYLSPHHDSSTYTINMALNRAGVDYEGGGTRFVRYNCSVPDTKVGWALLHPGRLTHYHEGLPLKSGTRYIMVSFVDPPFVEPSCNNPT